MILGLFATMMGLEELCPCCVLPNVAIAFILGSYCISISAGGVLNFLHRNFIHPDGTVAWFLKWLHRIVCGVLLLFGLVLLLLANQPELRAGLFSSVCTRFISRDPALLPLRCQLAQQTMTEKRTGAVKDFRQCLGRIMKEAKEGYLLNWHYQAIEARHESHIAQVVQQEGKKLSRETAKRSALIRATRAKSLEKSGRLLLRLRHDMERGLLQTWQRNFLARERDRTAELEATLKELQTKFSDNIRNTIQIRLELGSEKAEMEALHGAEVSKMRKCPHCRPKTEQDLVAAFQLAEDANQLLHQVHKGTLGGNKLSARCFDGVVDRGEFDDDQVASQLLPREACIVGGEKGGGEVGLQALFDKVGSRGEQLQGQFPLGVPDTGGGETGLMAEWAIKEYKLSRQAQHLMAKLTQLV